MITEIKQEEFKEKTKEGFVLLDVYGIHCGPCKTLAKTLEALDFDYPFLTILKLCADDSPEFCKEHKILGVPVLFFIKDGEIKEREVGALSAERIMELCAPYLYE